MKLSSISIWIIIWQSIQPIHLPAKDHQNRDTWATISPVLKLTAVLKPFCRMCVFYVSEIWPEDELTWAIKPEWPTFSHKITIFTNAFTELIGCLNDYTIKTACGEEFGTPNCLVGRKEKSLMHHVISTIMEKCSAPFFLEQNQLKTLFRSEVMTFFRINTNKNRWLTNAQEAFFFSSYFRKRCSPW